jgi:serine/threonine-protein kinase HipA
MATLDVYVNERLVGTLSPAAGGAFVFSYLPDIPVDAFVSLTLPVQLESYRWSRGLPPFFQMNLPEGFQKELLQRRLGPHADVSEEGLLALTGNKTIGRVRVVPHGQLPQAVRDDAQLATLLASAGSRERLLRYLADGITEGVSGVMPKTLIQKATVATGEYILKTGPADIPALAINEFLCLEVARKSGLSTPETHLSNDGEVLAVRRFDRTVNGEFIGVEDFCALLGLDPVNKYNTSIENLGRMLIDYVTPIARTENAVGLFKLISLNYALRNADAHSKNYALTYSSNADVKLAPAYDIVTVTAYPEFKDNPPALTLAGKKVWPIGKFLHRFGASRLTLTEPQMQACVEEIQTAATETFPEVVRHMEAFPAFREVGKHMLSAWEQGTGDIESTAPAKRASQTRLIERIRS